MPRLRSRPLALTALTVVALTACGDIHDVSVTPTSTIPTTLAPPAPVSSARPHAPRTPHVQARAAALKRLWDAAYVIGVAHRSETAVKGQVRAAPGALVRPPATAVSASDAGDYHSWPDWPEWRCVGQHEQGAERGGPYDTHGDGIAWAGSGAGGLPGSGYPGGLGIMRAAWDDARGAAGVTVTNGALASPADQIRVGRVIVSRFGWHAWAAATVEKCGLG